MTDPFYRIKDELEENIFQHKDLESKREAILNATVRSKKKKYSLNFSPIVHWGLSGVVVLAFILLAYPIIKGPENSPMDSPIPKEFVERLPFNEHMKESKWLVVEEEKVNEEDIEDDVKEENELDAEIIPNEEEEKEYEENTPAEYLETPSFTTPYEPFNQLRFGMGMEDVVGILGETYQEGYYHGKNIWYVQLADDSLVTNYGEENNGSYSTIYKLFKSGKIKYTYSGYFGEDDSLRNFSLSYYEESEKRFHYIEVNRNEYTVIRIKEYLPTIMINGNLYEVKESFWESVSAESLQYTLSEELYLVKKGIDLSEYPDEELESNFLTVGDKIYSTNEDENILIASNEMEIFILEPVN